MTDPLVPPIIPESFRGPKGDKGDRGDMGLTGLPGKDGKDAPSLMPLALATAINFAMTIALVIREFYR